MSRIHELIKEKCPNGVKYKKLGDIASITTGKLNANQMVENGIYPFFTCNSEPYRINTYAFDTEAILISGNGSQVGHINYYQGKFNAYQRTYVLDQFKDVNIKYMFHWFKCYLKKYIKMFKKDGSVPYITLPMLQDFKVAIPPLEVQEEIVRILDKFGELEAELEVELEVRKQQYEFWCGKLLNNDINIKKLGDIATFSQGIQVDVDKQFEVKLDGMVQFLRIVDFVKNDEIPRYIYKPDDRYMKQEETELVMIRYGASAAGKVFLNKSGAIANNMFKINLNTNGINIKYLWHYLSQNSVYKLLNNTGGGSTMPAINFKMVSSLYIPIPPLKEQQRIVNILDKFDKLVNDISEGLPAEIELRRKQYEYYRNKLLSFEEL